MAKSYIFDANKTTPAEVARRRKIAEALAGPYRPTNIGEGLSAIGAAFGSRIAANRASKAEQAGYAHAGEVMSPIFEGFFGGGSSAAPATADAGGVPSPEPIKTDWNGDPGEFIQYANQGAIRNQPLSEDLVNSLGFMQDMGLTMKVFSGGQDATGPRRTGSHRHDGGNSADVFLYKDGRKLDWANPDDLPIIQEFVSRGKAAGLTGFGAGEGYMQPGSLHIGFGSPAVWGAGGKGANAPDWLRTAYSTPYQPQQGQPQPVQVASASPTSLRDGVRMAYARLDGGMPVPSPAGGAAAPVSAPPPQAPGPQVAQAQPQGGQQPQPKLGQSMVGLPTLLKAAQDPWVAQNPLYSGIINQLISIELKARMPMSEAEKMDLDMKRLQLEKTALEIGQMRNPQMSPADQARIGLDREKFKFEQDQAGQTDDTTEYDLYVKQMEKIGQQPLNFLEYQQALRKAGTPNNYGSIPQGYELQETPQGARLVPIAGGPADTSQQDDAKLRNSANDAATLQQSINSLSEVMGSTDLPVFGTLSRPFALYSGSPAGKARSYLKQITSGVALDAMTRLKEASKQGATGFGALSERELEILVSKMGALDPDTTDPQIIKETLDNIQRVIDQVKKTVPPEKIKEWGLEALVGDSGGSDIPQEAADMLRANPETAEQFDQIFGAGSAAKILGGK